MLDQFDRLRKRNAFLEQYKKEKMFENGLEEFDDARYDLFSFGWALFLTELAPCSATAEELFKEYKACESPDYITYVRLLQSNFQTIRGLIYLWLPQGAADNETT
jgi:tubulin gamma